MYVNKLLGTAKSPRGPAPAAFLEFEQINALKTKELPKQVKAPYTEHSMPALVLWREIPVRVVASDLPYPTVSSLVQDSSLIHRMSHSFGH